MSLNAGAIKLDAVQSGTPFTVALIIHPVVFDLQASGQIAGTEDSHGDRQILSMTACTRRDILSVMISTVGTCRGVPRAFDRLHRFPADAQGPEKIAGILENMFLLKIRS